MFFNRSKPPGTSGLSDGIENKVAAFVRDWGSLQRGQRQPVTDSKEPPLQLITDADVAYFVKALEDEAARIETELQDIRRQRNAEIAQKDAQIASLNREIENTRARIQSQNDEISRRADKRADLLDTVRRIDPQLDASTIMTEAGIRREVVRRKFGDQAVDDRSEAYVDERFESLEARAKVDPFALVVADGIKATGNSLGDLRRGADEAYQRMVQDLNTAHNMKH